MTSDDDMVATFPVPVNVRTKLTRITALTKFFGAVTALALVVGMLVALIAVTTERDSLQSELFCRSAASIVTTRAINVRDNLIARALVDVANNDIADIQTLVHPLQMANDDVDVAIAKQEVALRECGNR